MISCTEVKCIVKEIKEFTALKIANNVHYEIAKCYDYLQKEPGEVMFASFPVMQKKSTNL